MFRRKKKEGTEPDGSAAPAVTTDAAAEANGEVEATPPPPEPSAAQSPEVDEVAEPAAVPVATETPPGDGEYGPGYVDDHLPPRVWVESVLDTRPPPSREELERQAAADFQAAIAPSLEKLREAVPDASSPEEARRALEEREQQTELRPDPEGDLAPGRDIYRKEASIHYRIQRQLERPRRRAGWSRPWTPPAGLARPAPGSSRAALGPGEE